MIIFKTFLKILRRSLVPILMYTTILIFFAGFNMQTSENNMSFIPDKPDVLLINEDEGNIFSDSLVTYMEGHSHVVSLSEIVNVEDALFYRDINFALTIPKGYGDSFLNGKNPQLEVKSTGDYQASLAEMLLSRYLKIASVYEKTTEDPEEVVRSVLTQIDNEVEVSLTSHIDTNELSRVTYFYNFLNYSFLAGCVYVICLILSSFREEKINKRTIVSSINEKTYQRVLLLSNGLFALVLWILYVLLSYLLLGSVIFSMHGVFYLFNSFVFLWCVLLIAFLIGNLIQNKNAVNGIVNVVSLGSSFLCGAFVPMEFLPDGVLFLAHILPSYYFIKNNEILKTLETFTFSSLQPFWINLGCLIFFCILFWLLILIHSKWKERGKSC